jgi:hypothetical protein
MVEIFVFGSNLAGRHGKGAALEALRNWGAIAGQGVGFQGRSYAIPTKSYNLGVLPLCAIQEHVNSFLEFARQHPWMTFRVTAIGCGLAGYRPIQIAPMFDNAPSNCNLPEEFYQILEG